MRTKSLDAVKSHEKHNVLDTNTSVRADDKSRFVEHLKAFTNNKPADSADAHQMLTKDDRPRKSKRNFDHTCLNLLKKWENLSWMR
jgi:hypothetical protein